MQYKKVDLEKLQVDFLQIIQKYFLRKSNRDTSTKGVPKASIINYSSTEAGAAAIALVTLPERRQRVQA